MNIPLLRQVQSAIIQNHTRFNMGRWDCGTTACIAGWAVRLSGETVAEGDVRRVAQKLLGLSVKQTHELFYRFGWGDSDCRHQIAHAKDTKARAKIAASYIDEFIERHENRAPNVG